MSRIPYVIFILSNIESQVGGKRPIDIMDQMKNIQYNFAKTMSNDYIIKFTDKNTKRINDTRYVGSGTYTAVFSVDLIKQPEYSSIPNQNLILRVFTEGSDGITNLINFTEKYEREAKVFNKYLPEIYLCGRLVTNRGDQIASFLLVKEYYVLSYLHDVGIIGKLNFVYNLLELNKLVRENRYNLCDLKFSNLGFYINDSNNFVPVIIDYDMKTLNHIPQLIRESKPITVFNYGTFLTYGLIKIENLSKITRQPIDLNILDKAHYGGLAQVIFNLFKIESDKTNQLIENVFDLLNNYVDEYIYIIRKINAYKRYYETSTNKIKFLNEIIPNDTGNRLQKILHNYFDDLIKNLLFSDFEFLYDHEKIFNDYIRRIYSIPSIINPPKIIIDNFITNYNIQWTTILHTKDVLDIKRDVQRNIIKEQITKQDDKPPSDNTIDPSTISIAGVQDYKQKYIKYKLKYLKLKNKFY
jgi:hypothetical protein